jgi:xylan 1,4-beta-xylosidase
VDAIAVRSDREMSVLIWNYHDDDVPGPEAAVQLQISGLSASAKRATLRHYRIDETHSNAWTAWKNMGSPQQPTPAQYKTLEAAGQLQELKPPATVTVAAPMNLEFQLPRQAISLVQLSW